MSMSDQEKLDRATSEVMSRKLTKEELSGFVEKKAYNPPNVHPFVKVSFPSREEGRKGYSVTVGIKGKF